MKKLLLLMLTGLSYGAYSYELDDISLITPKDYKFESSLRETFTSNLAATAASTFKIDISKRVFARVEPNRTDLQAYYPNNGELDTFVNKVVQEGIRVHLKEVNDSSLSQFYKYLGNNLVGKFADRILEKEGVSDPERRKLWAEKLTEPFNKCMAKVKNFQYDSDHCLSALIDSLVPSAGVGIVYELSRSNLNSTLTSDKALEFNKDQVERYRKCLPPNQKTSGADVKQCALSTMKVGVLNITGPSLNNIVDSKASKPENAEAIKLVAMFSFNSCTNKVGSDPKVKTSLSTQFMDCIDNLVGMAGTLLVQDKIENTSIIAKSFTPTELKKLSSEKGSQFKKCAEEQKLKGIRSKGLLNIDECERTITNEVTYKVVSKILGATAEKTLKFDKAIANKTSAEGEKLLASCWSNTQTSTAREACLKKTIVTFSQNLSSLKLEESIPDSMPGKSELTKSSVASFAVCIESNLPSNISESTDLTQRIDQCTGKLTRNVALKVADHLIRDTAKGNLTEAQTNTLINKLITTDFAKCIGDLPSDEQLAKCTDTLSKKAALQISEVSFSKEVFGYIEKAGGFKKIGLTKSDADQFLLALNSSNKICIESPSKVPVMEHVNSCLKKSIKSIATYFGEAQFNKSIGTMYAGRENEKAQLENRFRQSLDECLSSKDSADYSISDYTKNLYVCSEKVGFSTTMEVGKDQVETALTTYIKDRPNLNLSQKRESLRSEILGHFQDCLKKSTQATECIDELKREATKNIVLSYGAVETKVQLNTNTSPDALKDVESAFTQCTEKKLAGEELSLHLDKCTKNYALNFARVLGALKMNYLMLQTLGSVEYKNQKSTIDTAIDAYNSCLKKLEDIEMKDGLTSKLSICTDKLTVTGMNIVRASISSWMSSEEKEATIVGLKKQFSDFLPCLSVLLPSSPYSPQLEANISSSVKPLAKLLAQYIDYNPDNAKQTLAGVIKTLSVDLSDITKSTQAKKDLIDFLYTSGALDQLLKGVVRGTVKDAFAPIAEKDVPAEMRNILLKKENFEEIFNGPGGVKIKLLVMDKILKPILLDNIDTSGIVYKTNFEGIKDNIIQILVDAPRFGEQAIIMGVQKQINEMGGVKKFFAKKLYGEESLEWEKVRTTPDGQRAEAYIKENILLPKFKGTVISDQDQEKINTEAEKMVSNAVKTYRKK